MTNNNHSISKYFKEIKDKIKQKEQFKNKCDMDQDSFNKISKILNTIYFWDYNLPSYQIFKWMKYIIDNFDEKTIYKQKFLKAIQKLIVYTTINGLYEESNYDQNKIEKIIDKTFKTKNFDMILSHFDKKRMTLDDVLNTDFNNKNGVREKLMMYMINVHYGDRLIDECDYIVDIDNMHYLIHPSYCKTKDEYTLKLINSFANITRFEHHVDKNPKEWFTKNHFNSIWGMYLSQNVIDPEKFNYDEKIILIHRAIKIVERINQTLF